jgi:hypothetical protein
MRVAQAERHARNALPLIREAQAAGAQAAGARSLADIAAALNRRGVETARDASWSPMTVKRGSTGQGDRHARHGSSRRAAR